jgi:hypothetical protein
VAISEYITREVQAMNAAHEAAQQAADAAWAASGLCGKVIVTVAKRREPARESIPDLRQYEMKPWWEQ